jgi:hypothetical protein
MIKCEAVNEAAKPHTAKRSYDPAESIIYHSRSLLGGNPESCHKGGTGLRLKAWRNDNIKGQ